MYARARRGEIPEFTGISAPYEIPINPDLAVHPGTQSLDECVEHVLRLIQRRVGV